MKQNLITFGIVVVGVIAGLYLFNVLKLDQYEVYNP